MDVLHLVTSNNTIININNKQITEYSISTIWSILSIPYIPIFIYFKEIILWFIPLALKDNFWHIQVHFSLIWCLFSHQVEYKWPFLEVTIFLSLESNGQSPQVHILLICTDLYFTFCTRRERGESLKYHHSASRHRQLSIILCYEKGKWAWQLKVAITPGTLPFIYVDSLGVGKVSNIS